MNPNIQSTKFQLTTLVAIVGILSPFVVGVSPTVALLVVGAVVIAYMFFNVMDKSM